MFKKEESLANQISKIFPSDMGRKPDILDSKQYIIGSAEKWIDYIDKKLDEDLAKYKMEFDVQIPKSWSYEEKIKNHYPPEYCSSPFARKAWAEIIAEFYELRGWEEVKVSRGRGPNPEFSLTFKRPSKGKEPEGGEISITKGEGGELSITNKKDSRFPSRKSIPKIASFYIGVIVFSLLAIILMII